MLIYWTFNIIKKNYKLIEEEVALCTLFLCFLIHR